jgi:hypothetical protein
MKRKFVWRALPIGCLLLASCSGESGDSAPSQPISTPTPTPTPTATPSTYLAASDFTRDRTFTAVGLRISVDRSVSTSTPDIRIDPEGAAIGFDFAVATRTYTARYLSENITAMTQAAPGDPSIDQYQGANSSFLRSPLIIGASATGVLLGSTYVGIAQWNDNNGTGPSDLGTRSTLRRLLFGARTLSSDLPKSGAPTFSGQSNISGPGGGGGGNASIVLDYAARTISGTTVFTPASTGGTGSAGQPAPAPETITFTGTLDPTTGRVSGMATHVLTGATGKFEGALYGPAASEAAILFVIQRADNAYYYGSVAGQK